jgi:hypothetical protein
MRRRPRGRRLIYVEVECASVGLGHSRTAEVSRAFHHRQRADRRSPRVIRVTPVRPRNDQRQGGLVGCDGSHDRPVRDPTGCRRASEPKPRFENAAWASFPESLGQQLREAPGGVRGRMAAICSVPGHAGFSRELDRIRPGAHLGGSVQPRRRPVAEFPRSVTLARGSIAIRSGPMTCLKWARSDDLSNSREMSTRSGRRRPAVDRVDGRVRPCPTNPESHT